jgi:hypothetical protein
MARYRCLHFYLTPEQTGREKTSKQHYDEHSIYLGLSLDIVDFAIKKGVVATSSRNSVSVDALLQIIDFVERQSRQLTIDSMLILKARAAAAGPFFCSPLNQRLTIFAFPEMTNGSFRLDVATTPTPEASAASLPPRLL